MDRKLQFKYMYRGMFKQRPTGIEVLDKLFNEGNTSGDALNLEELNSIITMYTGDEGDRLWLRFLDGALVKDIFSKDEISSLSEYFSGVYGNTEESKDKDAEESKEENQEEEQVKRDVNIAESLFSASIEMLVNSILEGYSKLFEAGFQLKRPVGILGDGVLYSLSGNELKRDALDPIARAGRESIINKMGLTVCEERSVNQIANIILTGKASKNDTKPSRSGRLYFPLKMVEYAYGRVQSESLNVGGKTNYGNLSDAKTWKGYAEKEVRPSLTSIFKRVAELLCEGKDENITFEEENQIKEKLNSLVNVFLTCAVISEYNAKKPDILRIKVYDPYDSLRGNVATEIVERAYGSGGGEKGISQNPIIEGDYKEFVHEVDHILYNAEPLFAYKAATAYREQGKEINRNNMLIGLMDGSSILPIGSGGIDLTKNLSHGFIAGSRSGKGLQTQLVIANSLLSKTPIFYVDNKPDMGSLIKFLCEDAFVVNGGNVTTNPEDGTDYFEMFRNPNHFVREDTPDYVKRQFGSDYSSLGNFYYVRSVLLIMSIIALRVEAPELLDNLGGQNGIVAVIDELANASDGLNNLMQFKGLSNIARTGFYNEYIEYLVNMKNYPILLQEWEEAGSKGTKPKEPKEPKIKPDKGAYWFAAFYKSLADSILEIQRLDKAGLRNSEVRKSDVFVLSQVLHEPSSNVSELFARRNKESNNPSVGILSNDVLSSLCMIGNTDGFIGYNAGKPNYLGQRNQVSKAYGKLDQYARNFAYVESIVGNGKRQIESGSVAYANQAVYYKPFLMFSDGSENGYFVKNAFKYAEAAGIDIKDLIARNEDPNRPGHLDPRVGFKEYLLDNGSTEEGIKSTLRKSADIANFVVKNIIGYPGNWSDFIFDLRPEWIFSIDQVVNAFKNGGFASVKIRLNEFTAVYPEEFGLNPEDVLPRDVEDESFDNDLFLEDCSFSQSAGSMPEEDEFVPDDVINNFSDENEGVFIEETVSKAVEDLKSSEEIEVISNGTIFPAGEAGVEVLVKEATDAIIAAQGGSWGVETFEDIYGKLRINEAVVKMNFSENQLSNLPHHYRRRVKNNLWGELFDYRKIGSFRNLRELTIINRYSLKELAVCCGASRRITDADGWFFDNLPSLRSITTEAGVFRRNEVPEGKKIYYPQNASLKISDFCSELRNRSWGYTKSLSKRQDLGFFSKLFLGTVSGVFGAGVGVIEGSVKTGKGIKDWFSALRDVSGRGDNR